MPNVTLLAMSRAMYIYGFGQLSEFSDVIGSENWENGVALPGLGAT